MATVSVSIPDELKTRMFVFDEMNWSAVAKKTFEDKVVQLETLKRLSEKSKLTEKDAKELAELVNKGVSKHFSEMK